MGTYALNENDIKKALWSILEKSGFAEGLRPDEKLELIEKTYKNLENSGVLSNFEFNRDNIKDPAIIKELLNSITQTFIQIHAEKNGFPTPKFIPPFTDKNTLTKEEKDYLRLVDEISLKPAPDLIIIKLLDTLKTALEKTGPENKPSPNGPQLKFVEVMVRGPNNEPLDDLGFSVAVPRGQSGQTVQATLSGIISKGDNPQEIQRLNDKHIIHLDEISSEVAALQYRPGCTPYG